MERNGGDNFWCGGGAVVGVTGGVESVRDASGGKQKLLSSTLSSEHSSKRSLTVDVRASS